MGQVWSVSADGGYMYADQLSDVLRIQVQPLFRFRQHCDAKDATEKGLGTGETYNWNVYSKVATAGGALVETTKMPETKFTIVQGSLTVTEYGNSVPYTGKLDDLSKHPVKEVIRKVLKNDCADALDAAAYAQFNSGNLVCGPTSGNSATAVTFTTNGTVANANNAALTNSHVKAIVDYMKERDIPTFASGDYFCLARPTTYRTLKNNLESIHQYTDDGYRKIVNGEIGRYEGVRFVEQTGIASESWSNAASDGAFFFGEDTVAEAICIPEEVRGKIPTDFGRDKGLAWYYLGGFGIVHSDVTNERIVKWDSPS